jgi:exodeoxyribonuclease-5
MEKNFFVQRMTALFPSGMTTEQRASTEVLGGFLTSRERNAVMLLKGYAGTGKTSMLSALVRVMTESGGKVVLMAPTGRAAKVFAEYSGQEAFTVHRKLYRPQNTPEASGLYTLIANAHHDTLFIADEASMLSNDTSGGSFFGSGQLLDDLIRYVYSGDNCRLILSGDPAQLPPVSHTESPALNAEQLRRYNLVVTEVELTQVVRQEETSGILYNATLIRNALSAGTTALYPVIVTAGYPDVKLIGGDELIEELSSAYARDGIDETMVICRSNKSANIYNNGIRNRVLFREEELSSGDRLMVCKNNYALGKTHKELGFVANGEIINVVRVRRHEDMYGFRFCNARMRFEGLDDEPEVKLLLDVLQCETPALPKDLSDKLYAAVAEEYDTEPKTTRMKSLREDPYLNALQVKYAYAVTCHKAQGGQWRNVFLDIGYVTDEMLGIDFYRWLYTAFTRATHRLYLVNFRPKK